MSRVDPNPPSPFANAAPDLRHLFPVPALFAAPPVAGTLASTGCNRLAVVPDNVADAPPLTELPENICPDCARAMRDDDLPLDTRPLRACRRCGLGTRHEELCAICRQSGHLAWQSEKSAR